MQVSPISCEQKRPRLDGNLFLRFVGDMSLTFYIALCMGPYYLQAIYYIPHAAHVIINSDVCLRRLSVRITRLFVYIKTKKL